MYDFELTDEEMEQIEALEKNEKHGKYLILCRSALKLSSLQPGKIQIIFSVDY